MDCELNLETLHWKSTEDDAKIYLRIPELNIDYETETKKEEILLSD